MNSIVLVAVGVDGSGNKCGSNFKMSDLVLGHELFNLVPFDNIFVYKRLLTQYGCVYQFFPVVWIYFATKKLTLWYEFRHRLKKALRWLVVNLSIKQLGQLILIYKSMIQTILTKIDRMKADNIMFFNFLRQKDQKNKRLVFD